MSRRDVWTRYCSLHVVDFPFLEECPYCIQAVQAEERVQEVHKSSYNEGYEDGYGVGRGEALEETGNRASEAYDRGYSEGLAAGRRASEGEKPDRAGAREERR